MVVAFALAAGLVVTACGGAASPTPGPTSSASPAPIPEASFTGGTASARLDEPSAVTWKGGRCERGPGDAWLALNIGYPNGAEYFGLVVGQSAYTPNATRTAAGGGTFGGSDTVITWRHLGEPAVMVPGGLVLEVAKDLRLGTFTGRLADGTEVRGSFAC